MASNKKSSKRNLTLPAGVRLDKFLAGAFAAEGEKISRTELQRLIEDPASGFITGVPAKHLKPSFRAKHNLEIEIALRPKASPKLIPLNLAIPIVYEDRHLAVVHKPAGMTVHPGAGTGQDTLVHVLLARLDKLAPDAERPGIVHRLDRETEGLMIVAKTHDARQALTAAFAERKIRKRYVALVWGAAQLPERIDGYIARDPKSRKKMKFSLTAPAGKGLGRVREAQLIVLEQERHKCFTQLTIELITGRTHQIRTTMAYYNAPIIGDAIYGSDKAKVKLYKLGREARQLVEKSGMMLVARSLEFKHPLARKKLSLNLDLPDRFAELRRALAD